jgi:hypothetical protein
MNDLMPFPEANYSLRQDRGSRAMAGFSFGGMQTLSIGLCAHLKDFAWFAGLDPAGPGTLWSDDIAERVATENPRAYPIYYLYISVGTNDGTSRNTAAAAANGMTKGKGGSLPLIAKWRLFSRSRSNLPRQWSHGWHAYPNHRFWRRHPPGKIS